MNKKSWLIAGLSLVMAASIGVGISACGGEKEPDTPPTPTEHTHTYDAWDYNETQHWKYCDEHGTDKSNIDETTREGHIFTNGTCECGMKEADVTPDEGRDTRVFYVVGSGAGDLSKCSFTELKSNFMLTKQPKKDENGYTVYATAALTLYAGDTMKIVQDLDWDEGLGYFGVSNIKNNDGSLVDGGGPGNITPAVGKDGKYIFIVRTKPDIAFSECTLEFELVEPVEPLKNTEQIYIVGLLQYCDTKWPSGKDVTGCQKLDYDEETGEWSITLRLGGYMEGTTLYYTDEFKLFNAVNGAYIPDGVNNNKLVSGATDHTDSANKFYKASGDYKISWKNGDADMTFTKLEHTHVFDRQTKDDVQHWNICWLDDTADEESRENHVYTDDQDATCNTCGYERHVHTYDQWGKNETQHWKQCAADGAIDESTRQSHTFDQEGNKCVCGQEQGAEACKHEGKINFTYTAENVPTPQEAGGTLHGICAECSEEVDVTYDVGVEKWNPYRNIGSATNTPYQLEAGKKYYGKAGTTSPSVGQYFGTKIEQAGTLTVRVHTVLNTGSSPIGFNSIFYFDSESYFESGIMNRTVMAKFLLTGCEWSSHATDEIKGRIETNNGAIKKETSDPVVGLEYFKIRFDESDAPQYVYFVLSATAEGTSFGLEVEFTPAEETISAPAEVALLPGKKN